MATSHAAVSASVSVDQSGPQPPEMTPITPGRTIVDENTLHFMEATGDDNVIHLNDSVARSVPKYHLTGRIIHGKLAQCVAIDIIRRQEMSEVLDLVPVLLEESWKYGMAMYPGEELLVRYSVQGKLRAGRIMTFTIKAFVIRHGVDVPIQTGTIKALIVSAPTQ